MGISVSFTNNRNVMSDCTGMCYGTMARVLMVLGLGEYQKTLEESYFVEVPWKKFLQKAEAFLRDYNEYRKSRDEERGLWADSICGNFEEGWGDHVEVRKEVRFIQQIVRQYNEYRKENKRRPLRFGGA